MRANFLTDLLSSVFERRERRLVGRDRRSLEALCEALLSERGEASGTQITASILDRYEALDEDGRRSFFALLTDKYDLDTKAIAKLVEQYSKDRDAETLSRLLTEAEPRRQELFRRLNRLPGATERLVRMRGDLLKMARQEPSFRRTDIDFQHLFVSWFNRGFLVLRRVDWQTPAHILEKIIEYEAVHAIGDWDDLRRRLQPPDRRCFAFFHPAMPDEPLIFVEVALTKDVPASIDALLADDREIIDELKANTAVFYSISNCQAGLAGVSFGSFLIKQVVNDLSADLPAIKSFYTLSPVPGLATWLAKQGEAFEWARDCDAATATEKSVELSELAAQYLLTAKRTDGTPQDAVARFHLGNGARLQRISPAADLSGNGLATSCGVMVNYQYDLASLEDNHEAFAKNLEVIAAKTVRVLSQKSVSSRQKQSHEHA